MTKENNEFDNNQLSHPDHETLNESIVKEENLNKSTDRKKNSAFRSGFIGGVAGGILAVTLGIGVASVTGALSHKNPPHASVVTTVKPSAVSNNGDNNPDISSVVSNVKDAVVSVINKQAINPNSLYGNFNRNRGNTAEESTLITASEGSGVIYKIENDYAYVVTNNHVISGSQELEVLMADGSREKAELIGSDQWTDLAVLKIKADKITTVAEFGNSDDIQVGQVAIAIGSPLGSEFATSVTQGIISAKERSVATDVDGDGKQDWIVTAIQTDAAINPGNSGGALVNTAGQVIGINSMKISKSSVEGMGFAIPSNEVVEIINQLEKTGKIIRPVLGISMYDLSAISSQGRQQLNVPKNVLEGVVVMNVQENSSASQAGLQTYDVITEIDGHMITSIQTLRKTLYSKKVGDNITITYYREGKKQTANVQLTGSENPSL